MTLELKYKHQNNLKSDVGCSIPDWPYTAALRGLFLALFRHTENFVRNSSMILTIFHFQPGVQETEIC